ncbi:hypothetical protein [Mycobacterium sp. OTB74]|jgi:hypothetical protein|uniref:hypothetical protein n=1 Tax=Mycobacterium sp. OTB74 TaxID=1853452 RepID=UPI0024751007|nr:hypothetical protein [Mycobacterium sp. OTB74]MDH6243007.1 hypothetical protein [Mycobacterium sp. OTB74]
MLLGKPLIFNNAVGRSMAWHSRSSKTHRTRFSTKSSFCAPLRMTIDSRTSTVPNDRRGDNRHTLGRRRRLAKYMLPKDIGLVEMTQPV